MQKDMLITNWFNFVTVFRENYDIGVNDELSIDIKASLYQPTQKLHKQNEIPILYITA